MCLSGGEINPKDGIGRPKVIEFINVPFVFSPFASERHFEQFEGIGRLP
jgi:hypothetical protein